MCLVYQMSRIGPFQHRAPLSAQGSATLSAHALAHTERFLLQIDALLDLMRDAGLLVKDYNVSEERDIGLNFDKCLSNTKQYRTPLFEIILYSILLSTNRNTFHAPTHFKSSESLSYSIKELLN